MQRKWLSMLLVLVAVLASAGCREYPVVADGESIELIAALRTACSSRRVDRLERTEQAVEARRQRGELTDAEYAAFSEVIATARAGDWEAAEQAAFRFQSDQVH